ncbi:putative HAD superfamily protein [Caldalkalibacillus uzonensis]|uniref:Nucleotidase n=1 Tax=Caldalkalibacillus uzonensis TaxID=353224 RepID=A0ABU0CTM6_9BACI|nr:hypothetical protein [Caldalkalibacillus uzonensis]MDQ0339778.1 putative HAD superfamily protein [Caldalkalibacillus uzonensis]
MAKEKIRKKLGIDIDGTVTDPATFVPYLNRAFNKNLTLNDITRYHLPPLLGVTDDEFWAWMKKHEEEIYARAPVADSAKDVLHELAGRHRLIYITARPPHLESVTRQWFKRYGLPYHHIELVGSHDKVEQAKQHGVELFLEDRLETANAMAEELDIPVILFNTPYNRGTAHRLIHRVHNWPEAKQKLTLLLDS